MEKLKRKVRAFSKLITFETSGLTIGALSEFLKNVNPFNDFVLYFLPV